MAILPSEHRPAGFVGAKDDGMEMVVTTGDTRCAKLQSNHHHQQANTRLFTGQMPFLSPNGRSTEGKM